MTKTMRITYSIKYLIPIIWILACSSSETKNQNKVTFISTSIDTLGLLINLESYPPKKVIYQYTIYDNSAESRLDFSAPSDAYLEAILLYDSIPEIKTVGQEVNKEQFEFAWLPNDFPFTIESKNIQSVKDSLFGRNSTYTIMNNVVMLKVAWN